MRSVASASVAAAVVVLVAPSVAQASVQQPSERCAQPDGRVSASVITAGTLFIGGSFTHVVDIGGVSRARSKLAAIDLDTCDLLPWKADATGGEVLALAAAGDTVYAGGTFTAVGGTTANHLAALSASTGAVLQFAATTDKQVNALTVSGEMLYAGGKFAKANGAGRAKLAAFDLLAGTLTGWRPTASGTVSALTPSADGARIYVGGAFTALDGDSAHAYIGAVDSSSGDLYSSFDASIDFPILALTADSGGVYAGGGGHGGHLVIWNNDGSLQGPVYQTDGGVQAVAVDGDSLYAGGHFGAYCLGNTGSGSPFLCDNPLPRRKLFEISLSSAQLTNWAPKLNSPRGVFTEAVDPATGDLYVGGDFTTVDGTKQAHLGWFKAA